MSSAGDSAIGGLGSRALLDVHLAEYNALTTRCTYWMAMQLGLWPLSLLVIPALLEARAVLPGRLLIWLGLFSLLVVVFIYDHLLFEQFLAVRYTEVELRRRIAALLPGETFWDYEAFLARRRKGIDLAPDWLLAAVAPVAVLAAASFLIGADWTSFDIMGLIANLCISLVIASKSNAIVKLRGEFSIGATPPSGAKP
jgi:hypothetical protein